MQVYKPDWTEDASEVGAGLSDDAVTADFEKAGWQVMWASLTSTSAAITVFRQGADWLVSASGALGENIATIHCHHPGEVASALTELAPFVTLGVGADAMWNSVAAPLDRPTGRGQPALRVVMVESRVWER